jgi:hypothetical protein
VKLDDPTLVDGDLDALDGLLAAGEAEDALLADALGVPAGARRRECIVCGQPFVAARRDARTCTDRCRQRLARSGLGRWRARPDS